MSPPLLLVVLAVAGLLAGWVNAIAGAGSMLTIPALMLAGLDAPSANATNRIAVLLQSVTATATYRRNGVPGHPATWAWCLAAMAGSILGAWLASHASDGTIRVSLIVAMLVMTALSFVKPPRVDDALRRRADVRSFAAFFVIGIYGGFLQVGVGILMLLYLALTRRSDLVAGNAVKVTLTAALTVVAIATFYFQGAHIDLTRGVVAGLASAVGGWLGAKSAVRGGEKLVRPLVVLAVLASVVKLAYDLHTR